MTKADDVLRDIEKSTEEKFLPIIGPTKGTFLVEAVKTYSVKRVLEVGTLVGYSSILIAKNLPEDGKVETIEVNPHSADVAKKNIEIAGLNDKITIHLGDAIKVIPGIGGLFDMAFLDAAKNEYMEYLKLCEGKVKKDGVIFADNVKIFAGEMKEFLDYVRNSGKYESRYIDAGYDGVEVSIKRF